MQCSVCNHDNRPGVRFCENCGNQLSQLQSSGNNQRYCPNCGQPNPVNTNFCSSCGTNFSGATSKPTQKASFGNSFKKLAAWGFGAFFIAYLIFNLWGVRDALSSANDDHTAEAEVIAVDFVRENFPELANAERTAYVANIQGTDFYVVDFVQNDPETPPKGVRILVDRLLRAVFTYEYIDNE